MICIFLFLCLITVTKLEDPCFTTKLIDDWRRSVANAAIIGVCDNLLEEGWYRVISGAGEIMPTECPIGGYRCGTTSPFWLSSNNVTGSLYPHNGNIVNRTTCRATFSGNCCDQTIDIRIKDCGCYYVYYLKHTTGCYSAYCFGDQLPCPDGLTSSTGFTPGCVNSSCSGIGKLKEARLIRSIGKGKRKKARRNWFPVFVAFEGNGKSVYDAWQSQSECNPLPTSFGTVGSQRHLRNSVVDDWNNANIRMVKVEFLKNNQVVAWMTFNGRNTDKMNWFSKSNLAQSSFNDLGSHSTFNYFSIAGDHQRKFYVNQNYGGCARDQGWMYVLDQNIGCPYERIGSIPMFLYTKNFTDRNWTRNIAEPADTMVISVLAEL